MGRRAAAEVERVDFARRLELLQLELDRPQIVADQIVAAGDEREVAVAAVMPAEGDVDVGRSRRRESRRARVDNLEIADDRIHTAILRAAGRGCHRMRHSTGPSALFWGIMPASPRAAEF